MYGGEYTMGMRLISVCWCWRWRYTGSAWRCWKTCGLQTPLNSLRQVCGWVWPQHWRNNIVIGYSFISQIRRNDKCSTLEGLKLCLEQLHLHFFPEENYKTTRTGYVSQYERHNLAPLHRHHLLPGAAHGRKLLECLSEKTTLQKHNNYRVVSVNITHTHTHQSCFIFCKAMLLPTVIMSDGFSLGLSHVVVIVE